MPAVIGDLFDAEKASEAEWNAFPWVQLFGWKAVAACAAIGLETLQAARPWSRIAPRSRGVVVCVAGRTFRATYRPDCMGVGLGLAKIV